jgi:uncharacterized protein YcbK (DUF882 family)
MDRRRLLSLAGGLVVLPSLARATVVPWSPYRLRLSNAHTGEIFDGPYRDENGPLASAMDELSYFLRDHHSGRRIGIDAGVLDFLAAVMDAVGVTGATVLSAYRTVETNQMLARTTFGVADNSQHLYGRALDINLGGRLEEAMSMARAMKRGGVGWYPRSSFFHIDSGPVRNWTLDGVGIDRMLIQVEQLLAKGGLSVSSKGELLLGQTQHPPSVSERLALHRAIAKATLSSLP